MRRRGSCIRSVARFGSSPSFDLAYFEMKSPWAVAIGSVSLFADGVDFLEDASVDLLIAFSASMISAKPPRVDAVAGLLLHAGDAVDGIGEVRHPVPPEPVRYPWRAFVH